MVIRPLHLRARRRLTIALRSVSRLYVWLDTSDGSTAVARLVVAGFSLVGAYVALRVYPHDLPAPDGHAGLLATVLQSRPIVFVGRIAILSVAVFAVLSIVARMWNREWLTKAGPFEIGQVTKAAEEENARLKEQVACANQELEAFASALEQMQKLS